MIKYGSTIRLKFIMTDNFGERVLYEEPFTFTKDHYKVRKFIEAFQQGVEDALKDLDRDVEYLDRLRDIPTAVLQGEIKRRSIR